MRYGFGTHVVTIKVNSVNNGQCHPLIPPPQGMNLGSVHCQATFDYYDKTYLRYSHSVVTRDKERRNYMLFNNYSCKNIRPADLTRMQKTGGDFTLLDVRTPQENAAQAIDGSYLIPLQELGHRMDELPKDKEIVVYCRIGNRSAYACAYLARMGYKVKNLEGGISLWNMAGNASLDKAS